MPFRLRFLLLTLLLSSFAFGARAQDDAVASAADEPAVLRFWNRDIFTMRATVRGMAPVERATNARHRLEDLPVQLDPGRVIVEPAKLSGVEATAVTSGSAVLFFVLPEDVDPDSELTVDAVAKQAADNLRQALLARAEQRNPEIIVHGVVLTVAASIGLAAVLVAILWLRRIGRRLAVRTAPGNRARGLGLELRRYLASAEFAVINAATAAAALVALYVWLTFVLNRFPYSAPWGAQLGNFLFGLAGSLAQGILLAIPNLFTVLVIFLITRFVARIVSNTLERVQEGSLVVGWLDRDTARATRWVSLVVIWLFAITVAYPYIPGSDSAAFKGVSVFAGLMLTIGSSGFVSHLLSGLIVVYSKALRTGEMVKVGDTMGTVTEVGAFSTRILTGRGEEVNIPNTVLVGSAVHNFSRAAGETGALLTTTLTIGYDAPWRQVHAMLVRAAERTPGLRSEPKPYVLQRSLSDFYVEYELRTHLQQTEKWFSIQSELNANIQDVFNEFGVQIMSPHFMTQPASAVVVPKSEWYAPPGDGLQGGAKAPPA